MMGMKIKLTRKAVKAWSALLAAASRPDPRSAALKKIIEAMEREGKK